MKKYYILGGMAAATALIAAATSFPTPFSAMSAEGQHVAATEATEANSNVATQADDAFAIPYYSPVATNSTQLADGWTYFDNNNDSKYWQPFEDTNPSGIAWAARIYYNSSKPSDDYLVSPKFHFEAGQEYVICYNWRTNSDVEKFDVFLAKSNVSVEEINSDKKMLRDGSDGIKQPTYTSTVHKVTFEEAGDYYVVFYGYSDANRWYVAIADLLVAKNVFAPAAVTKLTATPAAERELKCSLSWVLPTTDQFGATLTEEQTISAVKVYRDGGDTPIATLDGTATSFDDTAATGLTSGKHTYGVVVVVNDVESPVATVGPTAYVGPLEPTAVPVTFATDNADDFNLWSQAKADDVTTTWTLNTSYSSYFADFNNSGNYNNWLIAPPVAIAEAGFYRVGVAIGCNSNPEGGNVRLEYSTSTDVETMNPVGGEEFFKVQWAKLGATLAEYPEITYKDIEISTPGTYYFAIHNSGSGSIRYYVKYLSVEKTEQTPLTATNVTAIAADDESLNIDVTWTNPTKSVDGGNLAAGQYQVEIYTNNSTTPAATVTDGSESCRVAVSENGIYTVTVKTVAAGTGASLPTHPSATTGWVGSKTVAIPYSTTFAKDDLTNYIWKAIDANADGKTFEFYENSLGNRFYVTSTKEFHDYIVSPAFNLGEGFYKVNVKINGGSYSSPLQPILGLVKKGEFNEKNIADCLIVSKTFEVKNSTKVDGELIFFVEDEGTYQLVYGAQGSTSYNSNLELYSFSIDEETAYPDEVANLTATVSADNAKTINLAWNNPTVYFGTEQALGAIEAIVIERDGNVIATLEDQTPGQPGSYTDEDVPNGPHTYSVYATVGGEARDGDHSSATVSWVGGGASAPLTLSSEFPGWYADGKWEYNQSNTRWEFKATSGSTPNDDYLITCPLNIEEKIIYCLEFDCSGANYTPANDNEIAIKMGTGDNHRDFKPVGTVVIPTTRSLYTYDKHQVYVAVGDINQSTPAAVRARIPKTAVDPETEALYQKAGKVAPGDNRVAIHITDPGDTRIRSFSFTAVAEHPDATTSIKEISAKEISFDGSAVCFSGTAAVEVYNLVGACVASTSSASGSFNIAALGAGFYIVKVTTATESATLKVTIK